MNRGRQLGDGRSTAIPQARVRQRSSSVDILARGSYLPPPRGSSSLERKVSAIKQPFRASEKKPSFGNSFSKGSLSNVRTESRGSSFARGSSLSKKGPLKEPRPLSDKAYQKQCINELVEYLEVNGFPYSIMKSSLLLPTKKDFEMLFQFLYKFFDPKYEVVKIEDEVPKIMKSFGYPFTVTRSSLVSITRMSWPSLLGVIMWLLDVNRCVSSIVVENYLDSPDFEDSDEQRILLNYICGSYESGINDSEKDNDLFQMLVHKKHGIRMNANELMAKNDELEELIEKNLQEQAEFANLVEVNKQIEIDVVNYQSHIENMCKHIKTKTVIYDKKKSEDAEKEDQLKTLKAETSRLEALYKSQGFNGLHAQNFYQSQKETLIQDLLQKKKKKDAEEKELWQLEMEFSNLNYKAQAQVKEFSHLWEQIRSKLENALLQALQNTQVPAAKKLCREYNLKFPDIEFHPKFTDDLKPVLEFAKKYDEQQRSIQNIITSQDRHIHQMQMKISEMDIQYKLLTAKAKTKECDMKPRVEEMVQKVDKLECVIQNIDKEFSEIRRKRKDLEACLAEKKALKEQLIKEVKLKEEELQQVKEKGNETLEALESEFHATRIELESEKDSVIDQIDALFTFINENPLPVID